MVICTTEETSRVSSGASLLTFSKIRPTLLGSKLALRLDACGCDTSIAGSMAHGGRKAGFTSARRTKILRGISVSFVTSLVASYW